MSKNFETALQLRKSFKIIDKELLHWFPGHMGKGMKQMQQKLKTVDGIIEMHDARIPFTGRNPEFAANVFSNKPHILVLNKKDLSVGSVQGKVTEIIKKRQNIQHVIHTNCKSASCQGVKKIFPLMQDLITQSDRYNRTGEVDHNIMIIGVPNVGKSSLINVLRNKHLGKSNASPVGGVPGITRSVLTRIKISDEPLVYMLDTPGILQPRVKDMEAGLKLALCASIPDHLVGEDIIADYLLYNLNKYSNYSYMDLMGLEKPSDEIVEVLAAGAIKYNLYLKKRMHDAMKKIPNIQESAKIMTRAFRKGDLGKMFLDRELLDSMMNNVEETPSPGDMELLRENF